MVSVDAKLLVLAKLTSKLKQDVLEVKAFTEITQKLEGPRGLSGTDGKDGKDGVDGKDGKDGKDGVDGKEGTDGTDGVSVVDAEIALDGNLVITLSNGKEIDAGYARGERGPQGISLASTGGGNGGFYNIDGGLYNSVYGGTTALDAGGP